MQLRDGVENAVELVFVVGSESDNLNADARRRFLYVA